MATITEDTYDIIPDVNTMTEPEVIEEFCGVFAPGRAGRIVEALIERRDELQDDIDREDEPIYVQMAKQDAIYAIDDTIENAYRECMDIINEYRYWIEECMEKARDYVPVMTGNLRDSIRYIGNNWYDIDITIDEDALVEDAGTRKLNEVPFYDGAAPGSYAIMIPSESYLADAESNARAYHWWEGGTIELKDFRSIYWELEIKDALARQHDIEYDPQIRQW